MSVPKKFIFSHIIKKEKNSSSAYCSELDVCPQGETVEDANNNLKEAIILY